MLKYFASSEDRLTNHVEKLTKFQFEVHDEGFCVVVDRSDEFVVVGQQILEEPIGVAVCGGQYDATRKKQQQPEHPAPSTEIIDSYRTTMNLL